MTEPTAPTTACEKLLASRLNCPRPGFLAVVNTDSQGFYAKEILDLAECWVANLGDLSKSAVTLRIDMRRRARDVPFSRSNLERLALEEIVNHKDTPVFTQERPQEENTLNAAEIINREEDTKKLASSLIKEMSLLATVKGDISRLQTDRALCEDRIESLKSSLVTSDTTDALRCFLEGKFLLLADFAGYKEPFSLRVELHAVTHLSSVSPTPTTTGPKGSN